MNAEIPALSIRQPWVELILRGDKQIEVRRWSSGYRGVLWLHAGRIVDPDAEPLPGVTDLFQGGFVGSAVLDAVVPFDRTR